MITVLPMAGSQRLLLVVIWAKMASATTEMPSPAVAGNTGPSRSATRPA